MTQANSAGPPDGQFIYMSELTTDIGVTDRCIRKWVTLGRFPKPDGNLYGRLFWQLGTIREWKANALAGRFKRERHPNQLRTEPSQAA